jgi:hypothetical protein
MSPAPSERRPAPRPFTSQSVSGQKPQTWNRGRRHLFRQLAQLCILKYDLEQKAHRATCASQVLDLTACVGIRLDFLPASSARHISKLVLDRSDVRKVPVGMSRLVELSLGCGHLQLGFLPPSSSGMLCKLSLQSTEGVGYLTIYLPASARFVAGSLRGLGPCAPTLRSRLGFFRDPGTCLTYRLAGSTSLQT